MGHFIGMVNAFLIPVLDGSPVNLADTWDPGQALKLMESDGLTVGGGAVYYMTSLLDHPDFTPRHLTGMKYAGLGGSAVPVAVTRRLAGLGITAFRSYGSTEHPSITGSLHTAPEVKRLCTDGNALPGVEIRLADDGEILSRGPDLCLGYTDPALTERAFDDEGWYRTGDIGLIDRDGYLTITDRKSDIIIRGGENIGALEVEEVLLGLKPSPRSRSWPPPTHGSASTPRLSCDCGPGTPSSPSTRCAPTSTDRVSPGRSGRRSCVSSTRSRAPRAGRCRSSFSAGPLPCEQTENRILIISEGGSHAIACAAVSAFRRGQPPV